MSVTGKYELESSENFDGFMKAAGAPTEHIEMAKSVKPKLDLVENGDDLTMLFEFGPMKKTVKAKIGEEVTDKTPDGREVKATITRNGKGKFIQKQLYPASGFTCTAESEYNDAGYVVHYKWNGGTASQKFKRL